MIGDYSGGFIASSVPQNQVSSVPAGWIDIPGCYLGPPEYYNGCPTTPTPVPSTPTPTPVPVTTFPALPPPLPEMPVLTPDNITQPLPDITAATAPQQVFFQTVPQCSVWCDLNDWIAKNPVMAVVILGASGWLLWPKKR